MSVRTAWSRSVLGGVGVLVAALSSVPAAFGNAGRALRPLPDGRLVANVSWIVDRSTEADAVRGRIEYRPDGNPHGACSSIRFIQVARVQCNGGADYTWEMGEADRNLQRTRASAGTGVSAGYFVDHLASACQRGHGCSPYFRDSWANADESQDGFQAGDRRAAASLVDYPYGWDEIERISLESCARCVDSGEFLGCADWGASWPPEGARTIATTRVHTLPSATFLAALDRFDRFYGPAAPGRLPLDRPR